MHPRLAAMQSPSIPRHGHWNVRISFFVLGGMAIASAALTAWLARPARGIA
jgi:hypothetical protein